MPTVRTRTRTPTPKREAVEADVMLAVKELLEEGTPYNDLDIGRIAQRAGISRTAFYFYFSDKRELLERLVEEVVELLYEQADRWWSGTGEGPADLETALRNTAALYREHAAVLCAIVEVSGYDADVGDFWRGVIGRFIDATTALLDKEWGSREQSPSPAATAYALGWMTERTYYQALCTKGEAHWAPLLDALVAVWVQSVYGPR